MQFLSSHWKVSFWRWDRTNLGDTSRKWSFPSIEFANNIKLASQGQAHDLLLYADQESVLVNYFTTNRDPQCQKIKISCDRDGIRVYRPVKEARGPYIQNKRLFFDLNVRMVCTSARGHISCKGNLQVGNGKLNFGRAWARDIGKVSHWHQYHRDEQCTVQPVSANYSLKNARLAKLEKKISWNLYRSGPVNSLEAYSMN